MNLNPNAIITNDGVRSRLSDVPVSETERSLCQMAADAVVCEYHTWPPECDPDLYLDVLVDEATAAIVSYDLADGNLERVSDEVLRLAGEDL